MVSSTPNLNDRIWAYALPGPRLQKRPYGDDLIVQISFSRATIEENPAMKFTPLIHETNQTTLLQHRQFFLNSKEKEQHQTAYNIIQGLPTPFPLENVYWGFDFSSDQEPENLKDIISHILKEVRSCVANDQIEWMIIHILKLEKLEPEKYQQLFETKVQKHPLEEWFLEHKGDVKLKRYLEFIYKLGKESPADNRFHVLRSQKMEASEVCSICITNMKKNKQAISMPCSHTFHGYCILRWLQTKPSCPLCRFNLLSSNT